MTTFADPNLRATETEALDDPIRVMVVDDSAVVRGLITRMIDAEPGLKVVDSAGNGEQAASHLAKHDVDVLILDIEMPVEDGLTALPKLLAIKPKLKIIMASTLTTANAEVSLCALRMGAADYIPKPSTSRDMGSGANFQQELIAKVKALGGAKRPSSRRAAQVKETAAAGVDTFTLRQPSLLPAEVLAIGSSTGGPQALFALFGSLDKAIKLPILITQHMPPTFTAILAKHISDITGWKCTEAITGDRLLPGHVYVAPGDHHMTVKTNGAGPEISLTRDPPENFCRPAVDPMLRSLVDVYGARVLAVVLTGMGHDGLEGGRQVVAAGGTVIAQDEETSVVWGMPRAVAVNGLCSAVLPLPEIGRYLNTLVRVKT